MPLTTRKRLLAAAASVVALALPLAACSSAAPAGNAGGEISYWLWDSNQLPAYQTCAADFTAANPDIKVKVEQYGWGDYWTKLTNGFVAGTAPDVFTDHLAKYPEFVANNQLAPLDDVALGEYQPGLADLWVGQDGVRYGVPKDFDTVAIFYNKKLVADAGVDEASLWDLDWNPADGGTYEKMAARLTVDKNGVRGDEPGFDKNNVAVYGLGMDGGAGGAWGQTQWSMYTGTTGWTHTDKNPWGTKFNFDAPEFQDTVAWMVSMVDKGYMPPLKAITGQGSSDIFAAGKYAMLINGSWMTNAFFNIDGVEVGVAPTPVGPNGARSSAYNGLADSIWVGSKNQEAAKKWVAYLGSEACQLKVGEAAVVFPANPKGTEAASKAFEAKGIDVSAFLTHLEEGTTSLLPIIDKSSQVDAIMGPAMDAVYSGQAPVSSLSEANKQVNALFNS